MKRREPEPRYWFDNVQVRLDDDPADKSDPWDIVLLLLGGVLFLCYLLVAPVVKAGERFR